MTSSISWIELGHFAVYLALAASFIQGVAPFVAARFNQPAFAQVSVTAGFVVFGLLAVGAAALTHAFVVSDFSVLYVAQHSNTRLPMFYKVSAFWGGHEGSLYLWALVLALYTAIVATVGRKSCPDRLPVILAVQAWLVIGFLGLILFLSNPFERLIPAVVEGRDLNPLLQDPGMVIHPPMLYLGYVGFSVPFSFAMAALITRWDSELWVGLIRRWALVAWVFLTVGIMLGGWWAYYELGWGGYWAWDPVENASFMPWLVGTALIHSLTVQEYRRMLHTWNIFLIISTFSLSLLGTFLVRSGVLTSVHAFAVDPGRGAYILIFMSIVLAVSFGLFLMRGAYQKVEERVTSMVSRETMFLLNNVLFTVACFCVLLGTLYPLFLDVSMDQKITVAAPYFNAVIVPMLLIAVVLMSFGPVIPWRKARVKRLVEKTTRPAIAGVLAAVVVAVVTWPVPWVGPVAVGAIAAGLYVIGGDLWAATRHRQSQLGLSFVSALTKTINGNRRHYGGVIVHIGIFVIIAGLVGSGLFRSETSVAMKAGDRLEIGGYHLRFEGVKQIQRANYVGTQGQFVLEENGQLLTPEIRRYPVQQMPTTEAAIDANPLRDIYVVLGNNTGDQWAVQAYINPMVQFIWAGGMVIVFGVLFSLTDRRGRRRGAWAKQAKAGA